MCTHPRDALLVRAGDISLADDEDEPLAAAEAEPASGAAGKKRQSVPDESEESDSRPASKRAKAEEPRPAPQPAAVPKVRVLTCQLCGSLRVSLIYLSPSLTQC